MKTYNVLKVNSLIILFLILISCVGELKTQDTTWPQFRGINCSGLAEEGQNPPIMYCGKRPYPRDTRHLVFGEIISF
jgi:hypothetical protein